MQDVPPLSVRRSWQPAISVVVPAYNEAAGLNRFHHRLVRALADIENWEVVYVNDGSTDTTLSVIETFRNTDLRVAVVSLSRNFGKEIAVTAGLDHAAGDAVVIIDADLQDPPELIPELITCWRAGFDMVYAKRRNRNGDSWMKRRTAHGFYRLMQCMGDLKLPEDTGDFRLMSRRAVDAVLQLREQHRFMKGLFAWVGYPTTYILYDRAPRCAGVSKWSVLEVVEFGDRGDHQLHRDAAEARHLRRAGGSAALGDLRRPGDRENADHRQFGRGLPKPDDGRAVPWWGAADVSRRDRRISGQGVQ